MKSISTPLKAVLILTTAVCLNATLSLGDESPAGFHPALDTSPVSEGYIVLAQNTAAPVAAPEAKKDTVYIQVPAATARRQGISKEDMEDLMERRDHFQRMQNTGFGLLMGGIGCGAGGILLMIAGISEMERNSDRYDSYGNETHSDKGVGTFLVGYVALLAGCPALVTTGIILNRVGNHKRQRFQDELDEAGGHVDLNVGPNSMRLSYTF